MSEEIHPFVERMKETIRQALEPKPIKDFYSADEIDDIEGTGSLNAFLAQFVALISLIEINTQNNYLVFVRNNYDLQSKIAQLNNLKQYKVIGIEGIKRG